MARKSRLESLEILGKTVKIEYKPLLKEGLFGDFDGDSKTIRIDSGLKGTAASEALFHEMIHAALCISGQSETLTSEQEEGIVVAIENALAEYFTL